MRVRVRVGLRVGVRYCYHYKKKNKENITDRMAIFQLREVQVVGIPQFSSKITPKKFVSFILEQSLCGLPIFLRILQFVRLGLGAV